MKVISLDLKRLLEEQLEEWPLVRENYEALEKIESKEFLFDNFTIRAQFNPSRILSSSAKVDDKSIQERKCFLCTDNLPHKQRGIPFDEKYQILVNPYPIFPEHFTIRNLNHTDQLVHTRYEDMLKMAENLDKYVIFYNGPKCGASAPDHAHFQAGIKGFLPIENDISSVQKLAIIKIKESTIYTLPNYLRNTFVIESEDKNSAAESFNKLYTSLKIKGDEQEPMMNILTWLQDKKWYSVVFPREKHRPDCYYAQGEENILISPGTVDMGGVLIIPQEKDYRKITSEHISNILQEVSVSDKKMQDIIKRIKE